MRTMYRFILSFLVFAVLAGCEKRGVVYEGIQYELAASMEYADGTKTSLGELNGGKYDPVWSDSDDLAVFIDGDVEPSKFILHSGVGTANATFVGPKDGTDYYALYPFRGDATIKNGTLSFSLPVVQQYVEGSFGQGCYPMVAQGEKGVMNFKNLCAVLKVSITGGVIVESITLTANDSTAYMSGRASVSMEYASVPEMAMEEGGSNYVILQCGGVQLIRDKDSDFYFVLPAAVYKGGFQLTIETSSGRMVKSVDKDVTFGRSQIRELESFEFRAEGDDKPSGTLKGKGTETSPFLIEKVADMVVLQKAVNSTYGKIISSSNNMEVDARTACYKLAADIDLSGVCGKNGGSWEPIGNYSVDETFIFGGVFDGDNHKVTGLYIDSKREFQGLFGCAEGIIENLSVDGVVIGSGESGIVCGSVSDNWRSPRLIKNCISSGRVESCNGVKDDFATFGGIVGHGDCIENCINHASVSANAGLVGGICGSLSTKVKDCANYGDIMGSSYAGGIIGYQNAGVMYNSYNRGKVTGKYYVGGIAGYLRQGALLCNCYNLGDVEASQLVGGIVGMCDTYKHEPLETKIRNCVNAGSVKSTTVYASVGAICGYNVSEIANCYWLYDPAAKAGIKQGIGESEGIAHAESLFGLTSAQMRGEEKFSEALYFSPDSTGYPYLLDALNAFAYDKSTSYRHFSGWKSGEDEGCPVLTGKDPQKPEGEAAPVFEVSVKEIVVSYVENTIAVEVMANMDYYISSLPEWITGITTKAVNGSAKSVIHKFKVSENIGSEDRKGVIVFCNEMQQCIPVTVFQKAKTEADEWMEKPFVHRSLAMRFTADWCGYCPNMAEAFAQAQKSVPDKLELLSVHASGGLHSNASETLCILYGIEGFPTGIVDGRAIVNNYNVSTIVSIVSSIINETEEKYPTISGTSWNSSVDGNKISLDLNVYLKNTGSYKVTALLVEDNIVAFQAGASDSYNHKDVVRAAFSNALGDEFAASAGQIVNMKYALDIPAGCNKDNLRIVVYVQAQVDNGTYYINNAASAAVGKQQPLMVKSDNPAGVEGISPDDDIPYNN